MSESKQEIEKSLLSKLFLIAESKNSVVLDKDRRDNWKHSSDVQRVLAEVGAYRRQKPHLMHPVAQWNYCSLFRSREQQK